MLTTERLTIRLIEENDWDKLLEIWIDFGRSAYAKYDVPHITTEPEVKAKTKQWADVSHGGEHMFYAVCLHDEMIGYVDFHKNDSGYECGYCFHSAYHGQGYAKESLKALLANLPRENSQRCIAGTALKNTPSVHLLHTLGFRKVGVERVSFYQDQHGHPIFFDGGIFVYDL